MAKNVDHIQHIKSNVVLEGKPKLPQPGSLVEGELAINYAEGVETISIKNSSGDIVTFSSDDYYSKQKLGSAFTDANSAVTVTEYIEENELIVSTALNDLKENKLDASAYTPTDLSNYYTKSETSGATELSTEFELYVQKTDVDQVLDNTTSASTNPVSSKAVYDAVTDNELVWTNAYVAMSGIVSSHTSNTSIHITSADRDKLDSITGTLGTMAYQNTNSYSSATEINTALGNKANSSDLTTLSGTVTGHTADTTIHLTLAEKGQLHTHSNKSALDAITGNVGTMAYESTSSYSSATEVNTALAGKASTGDIANFFDNAKYELSGTTHVINFYNGNTVKSTIDATDFIKDGMIDTVSAGTSASTTVLVITWNTDAGKSQTILDIGDMFEADNYYTKSETSGATEISDALADKIASGDVVTAITESNSGSSAPVSVKVVAENEFVISTALNDLNANKLDVTAYTPTDLSNYYTKSQTSGATELSTAFGGKADTATTLAGYGITDAYTKSQTSGATELSTAFGNKADTATTLAGYGITDAYTKTEIDNKLGTGFTVSSVTEVIESNERVAASALNDLKRNKLDVSAFTEYSGAVNTTISSKASQTDLNTLSGTVTAHTANTTMHLTSTEKSQLHTHTNKTYLDGITGSVGTMAYQNTSSYSSATQVNTALGAKLDATAYTPTDLSNYYTKSETSGATELSTVFGTGFTVSSITEVIKEDERVTSEALNDLNTRIGTGFSISSVTVVMDSKADKTEDLDGVKLKKITQSEYDALVQAGTVDPNTLYIITD